MGGVGYNCSIIIAVPMEQGDQRVVFAAKLKAQTIKQIFKDLSPKNLKGVECFYFICSDEQLELQFISKAKDILINILLKRTLFSSYQYNHERKKLFKYRLKDFTPVYNLFYNNKQLLDLTITPEQFTLILNTTTGKTTFLATSMHCDEDDEDLIIDEKILRPEQAKLEVTLPKVSILDSVASYAKACKLDSLWFRYESVKRALRVSDKRQNPQIVWHLKLQNQKLGLVMCFMQIPSKMLGCALNLLPKDEQLILTFYSTSLLLDVPNKEKNYVIKINAKCET